MSVYLVKIFLICLKYFNFYSFDCYLDLIVLLTFGSLSFQFFFMILCLFQVLFEFLSEFNQILLYLLLFEMMMKEFFISNLAGFKIILH